jgi:sRNA-binding regulator protein Hfq
MARSEGRRRFGVALDGGVGAVERWIVLHGALAHQRRFYTHALLTRSSRTSQQVNNKTEKYFWI